jgi:mono/diheme cytochrome c family protein
MLLKNTMGLVLAGTIVLAGSAVLIHQGAATPQEPQQKTLKKVPIVPSKPESGKQMYMDYCAACHGPTGKGDGPAVEFLKAPPSDLTTMAKRNNGKFPQEHFVSILRFGTSEHPHGTSDMPVWGPLFRSQNKDVAPLRIANLSSYVESMQQK